MKRFTKILVPTDFSDACAAALRVATCLARDQQARLVLLHVVAPVAPLSEGGDRVELRRAEHCEQEQKTYQEEMWTKLERLEVPAPQQMIERVVVEGGVVAEIVRAARTRACDLIVMGTHGWTADARKLLGSVAEAVVQEAPCAVVTVKAAPPAANEGDDVTVGTAVVGWR